MQRESPNCLHLLYYALEPKGVLEQPAVLFLDEGNLEAALQEHTYCNLAASWLLVHGLL